MDEAIKAYLRAHKVSVGVSACLLGQEVRYDGRHKRHDWLAGELGHHVTWAPVCPEVELGMGVPRETIDLVRVGRGQPDQADEIALLGFRTGRDFTAEMQRFAGARAAKLAGISGYVFKSRSPSCGLRDVNVIVERTGDEVTRVPVGQGLFAAALVARFPDMPVAEEIDLDTESGQEEFIAGVVRYHRLTHGAPGQEAHEP